jgi:AraC family transcriptional regulator, exoenzyme S synthesis regulatory protein ExsA
MQIYHLPFDLNPDDIDNVIIRAYTADHNTVKNKIVLHRNMINLIVSGNKLLFHTAGNITISAGEFLILTTGNCLTTEIKPGNADFKSILLYFSNETLLRMLSKSKHTGSQPFLQLKQDDFIRNYVASLDLLLTSKHPLTEQFKLLKLEELLLYILDAYPGRLETLDIITRKDEDLQIKTVVENNISTPVTVEELAFLCNCSLSTFKRKFSKIYNTSPQKWLLEQKLDLAATLLQQGDESPATVYQKVGYENHSSFSQAFKSKHGITPKDYQLQFLH